MKSLPKRRFAIVAVACAFALALAGPVAALAALATNYDWYNTHESDSSYVIGTAGELKALAKLVNGTADYNNDGTVDAAVSFEGKTIILSEGLSANFLREAIEPIGTAAHPFQGTFDGTAREIDNFVLNISAGSTTSVQNVGLFGYVGDKGKLIGVSVGKNASISIVRGASSKDYVANVGMVAGYCAGTMENCSNAGSLSVSSAVVQQNKDDYLCVRNVGGVAGQCVYDMTGCTNSGAVTVSQTSSPVADYEHAQVVGRVGGVVGLLGDESRIGNYSTHIYGDPAKHGSLANCSNTGKISIDTPMLSGLDRFGEQANAESVYIGGVVGYSQGSVTNCTNGQAKSSSLADSGVNVGYVNAKNGVMVGGVCGSLRGVLADNTNIAWADDGADGKDPLLLSNCMNYGDVYGRVTVGGIVGKSSSYTTVTECVNSTKRDAFGNEVDTFVIATRWNKPAPGGIAGTANGEVSYCANLGTVASAVWKDEASRRLETGDGYYAAGIVGMLTYFDDQAPSHGGVTTPISEVFSCYNGGTIVAGANMRQRGIVGENDGYTHDNVLVKGLVYNDDIVYGDSLDEPEASGAVGENRVYSAEELRGDKVAEAIAFLNSNSEANGWTRYWLVPRDSSADGLNTGYPLLDSQNPWGNDAVLITDAATSLVADAPYTGGESVPNVAVSLNGTALVENADFHVVAQKDAIQPSTGKPYTATVVGLGRYQGTASQTVSYDIVAGNFAKCKLTAVAHTFDFDPQVPSVSEVTVRTPAGTVVDSEEYSYKLVDADDNQIDDPVDADIYRIVATPKEGSTLFYGKVEGTFRIKPASYMREVKFDDAKISHLGVEYPWVDSTKKGEADNPTTTLRYTGSPVKPVVGELKYKGHTLVEGTDYKVVYGNSNSDDGYPGDQDANNVGKKGGKTIGCVTIRYVSGKKTNFTSYANMFFFIADDGNKTDISLARAVIDGEQVSDGKPIEPVEVWLDKTKLVEGTDYSIQYRNNVEPGTAHYMVTGMGQFIGSFEGDFTIEEGSVYDFSYTFAGAGSTDSPFEATVTGVTYKSSRETFDMVIPETVEHEGNTYTVTAIGDSAFGGRNQTDFSGSDTNNAKLKIATVFVPATVKTIGAYAFGTSSITLATLPPLKSVEFGAGSQLQVIGEGAFMQCESLASFTFPENVAEIGKQAFSGCKALKEMRFMTTSATLPASVATGILEGAFYNCTDVVVRGFPEASAVRKLVTDNSKKNTTTGKPVFGEHGGKSFTFQALSSLASAQISTVSDQLFTGAAIKPSVTVTLNGQRLSEGTDYEISYENNVDAGTARVVARGIGNRGSQAVRTFTIVAADIGRASITRLADQPFTGQAVDLAPVLAFNNRTLAQGVDYDLAYSDMAGNAISAPKVAGSYRLVVTGKGNFSGATYRSFRIVAQSVDDATITPIGDKPYANGALVEPEVVVAVGGKTLERNEDYLVAYENNVNPGEATAHVYGIGSYIGSKDVNFRITGMPLSGAVVAGVYDSKAGVAVSFEPTVIVGGSALAEDDIASVTYYKKDSGSVSGQSVSTQNDGMQSVGNEGGSSPSIVAASLTTSASGTVMGIASTDDPLEGYTKIDSAPSEAGDYKLVIEGKGNYAGKAVGAFSITSDEPAAKTDLSSAIVSFSSQGVSSSDVPSFAYDGTAHTPGVEVKVGDSAPALVEGTDYVVAYSGNVQPGSTGAAKVSVYGIGNYSGSKVDVLSFTVASTEITQECIGGYANVEYTGSQVRPHLMVRVPAENGRVLSEGSDFTVEYGANLNPGTNAGSATVQAVNGSGYTGAASISFDIAKADVSGSVIVVEPDKVTYTGKPIEPDVTVTLAGRELVKGTDYALEYTSNTAAGKASVIVHGINNCMGTAQASYEIEPIIIAKPTAVTGLAYTGKTLTGVRTGAGYTVSGGTATEAGTFTATVKLAEGYAWPGGFTSPVTLQWSIGRASLSKAQLVLSASSFTFNGKVQKPSVKSVVLNGTTLPTSNYSVSIPSSSNSGNYMVTVSGKGSCTGTAQATYRINPATQKITVKVKKPSVKLKKLKKAKQTLKVGSLMKVTGAKTAVTYIKQKGTSAKLSINKKTGKVTIKKGTKKGTYKLKVKVNAAANANYKAASKVVTVKVKVK